MTVHTISRTLIGLLASLAPLSAAELVAFGVLGNSGACDAALVRCGAPVPTLGVVVDKWHTLWERGGKGVLHRLAADGRMLAQFSLPPGNGQRDRAVIAGEALVLLLDERLYRLPLDAASGTTPTAIKLPSKIEGLAPTSWQGRVLIASGGTLTWLDPVSGATTAAGPQGERLDGLEADAQGIAYVKAANQINALRDGAAIAGWPRSFVGSRPQLIDGHWYGQAYHSTVLRYDGDLKPDPGVALGGNSGSFIGHVSEDPEVGLGRGLAHLDGDEWAVSSQSAAVYLLHWDDAERQFTITRRLGGLARVGALGLDDQGRVSLGDGYWTWQDLPDAPLHESRGSDGAAIADLGKGRAVLLGNYAGSQGRLHAGTLGEWEKASGSNKQGVEVPATTVAAAAVPVNGGYTLVAVTTKGEGFGATLAPNGSLKEWTASVALTLAQPALTGWTALDRFDQGLIATVGGWIVVLERDGAGWRERERWRTWGGDDGFGNAIWLTLDDGRLWVADRDKHRVLCFDAATRKPLTIFGGDAAGSDLRHLTAPERLAASGSRCVVHDAGNQRLIKLELR
ncbi:MAG TPA: hypothetical protein VHX44_07805 [Planctomycetota bacterium]|nr:hypothetical protein [Planctomycetota bacterium]